MNTPRLSVCGVQKAKSKYGVHVHVLDTFSAQQNVHPEVLTPLLPHNVSNLIVHQKYNETRLKRSQQIQCVQKKKKRNAGALIIMPVSGFMQKYSWHV